MNETTIRKAIDRACNRIVELKQAESDAFEDLDIMQDCLYLILHEEFESKGFVRGVEVIHSSRLTGKKAVLEGIYLDRKKNQLAVTLNPYPYKDAAMPKTIYASEIQLAKAPQPQTQKR